MLLLANQLRDAFWSCITWSKAIPFVLFRLAERPYMSDRTTKHKVKEPEMRPEYDFSRGVRGKYYNRYIENTNVVVIEPDVHKRFKNAKAVNEALRSVMRSEAKRRDIRKRSTRASAKAARAGNR